MTTSFASVVDFHVAFSPNPIHPDVITLLNSHYSTSLPDIGDFFVDPAARTTVKTTNEIRRLLLDKLVMDLIITACADDVDPTDISDVLSRVPMNVQYAGSSRRLGHDSLTSALEYAVTHRSPAIHFTLCVAQVPFATVTSPGLHYFTWSESPPLGRGTTVTPPVPVSTASPAFTPADLAAAMQSLTTSLSTAFIAGVQALPAPTPLLVSPPTTPSPATPVAPTASAPTSAPVFNSRSLPTDVLSRYNNKLANGPILGLTTSTAYAGGYFYHIEGFDKLFLSDGTLFTHNLATNDKDLLKAPLLCDDDSHAGVRSWYPKFAQSCMDYGYYVHPLWSFRPDHGGERGFSAGPLSTDDLPDFMEVKLLCMALPLFRLLSKADMFPKGSRLPRLVSAGNGDGFRSLKNILFLSHPVFHDQPAIMVTNYPRQRDLDLFHYAQLFRDHLQLRAFVKNTAASLDDPQEIDVFINNMKHSEFIQRVTRSERRDPVFASRYVGPQLLETIMRHLMAPDSPLHMLPKVAPPPHVFVKKPFPRTHSRPVNYLTPDPATIEPSEPALSSPSNDNIVDPATTSPHLASLFSIQAPPTSSDQATYHSYCASVYRLHADPAQAQANLCLVCGASHRFDSCPVLQNTEFLRSHYIRYCQHLKRDAAARSASFPSGQPSATVPRPVRVVDSIPDPIDSLSVASAASDSSLVEMDFQLGRA
jgi:hypothetical protein